MSRAIKREDDLARQVEQAFRGEKCAYCLKPSEGNYSIHRDAFGEGPEVPLCDGCGDEAWPTCEEIWATVGQRTNCIKCEKPITVDERAGSYHGACYLKVQSR